MKKAIILIGLFLISISFSQDSNLPAVEKENFHLFLLAGQSNMAGRGNVTKADSVVHPRVFALNREGKWQPAVDPLHWDKKVAGVGLAKSFAVALAERNEDIVIGLIPAACGGSPISSWEPGGYHGQTKSHPYDDAIQRARIAMKEGVLKGILWHQGESDSKPELAPVYREKLVALIERFRKDLDAPDVPFIIGQLGQFPERPWNQWRFMVNFAHVAVAREVEHTGFVPSFGLTCNEDHIHFNSESLREFGRRYAKEYFELTGNENSI